MNKYYLELNNGKPLFVCLLFGENYSYRQISGNKFANLMTAKINSTFQDLIYMCFFEASDFGGLSGLVLPSNSGKGKVQNSKITPLMTRVPTGAVLQAIICPLYAEMERYSI